MDPITFVAIDFTAVMIAFMAVILFYALRSFIETTVYTIAAAAEYIPGIGSDIAEGLREGVNSIYSGINSAFSEVWQQSVGLFVTMLTTIANNLRGTLYIVANSVLVTALAFEHLVFDTLHADTGAVVSWAQNSFDTITAWTSREIYASQQAVVSWATTAYTNLSSWVEQRLTAVDGRITSIEQTIVSDVDTLHSDITTAFSEGIDYSKQVYVQATTYAHDTIDTMVQSLDSAISQDYDQLAGSITDVRNWAQQSIQAVENDLGGEIASTATLVLTNVLPRIGEIEKDVKECLDPMCENGLDFLKGLTSILGILEGGAMLALIAEAVRNPDDTAKAIGGEIHSLADGPISLFERAIGVNLQG